MKPKVLLDIDGVIANFYKGFALYLNKYYSCRLNLNKEPENYPFEGWGCGVDDIDFETASRNWIEQNGFEKLPSYIGAEDFVKKLMAAYNIFIVTARVGDWDQKFSKNTKNQIKENTYDWLKKRGIPTDNLHFAHEKISFCKDNGISVMIEDKLETALLAAKEGINTILMNRGYNKSKINRLRVHRAYNFDDALTQLKRLIK